MKTGIKTYKVRPALVQAIRWSSDQDIPGVTTLTDDYGVVNHHISTYKGNHILEDGDYLVYSGGLLISVYSEETFHEVYESVD